MAKKDLNSSDDLRESIAHVDQVSARIARLIENLNRPKPSEQVEEEGRQSA